MPLVIRKLSPMIFIGKEKRPLHIKESTPEILRILSKAGRILIFVHSPHETLLLRKGPLERVSASSFPPSNSIRL